MKKSRMAGGVVLPCNLYPDNNGNPRIWRYRNDKGSIERWHCEVSEAVSRAISKNERGRRTRKRFKKVEKLYPEFWVEDYIRFAVSLNPERKSKRSFQCYCYLLRKFAAQFNNTRVKSMTAKSLEPWWMELSHDQQKQRRSELNRLFQHMIKHGATTHNPFTKDDSKPRLITRATPLKRRLPLTSSQFWVIHDSAKELGYYHVCIAMLLSFCTTMRQGDVIELRFDNNLDGSYLRKQINKSTRQRGAAGAARLEFDLELDERLAETVQWAKEMSFANWDCPYLVSHRPKRRTRRDKSIHPARVRKETLCEHFKQARDATRLWDTHPKSSTPPTFHEIRGLAILELVRKGYSIQEVKNLAAHTDERITRLFIINGGHRHSLN